jgi:hypothetical protein
VAAAALLVAGILAMPRVTLAAEMQNPPAAQNQAAPGQPATGNSMGQRNSPESVDQRIDSLKSKLQITASEESDWNAVAASMRENAQKLTSLIDEVQSEKTAQSRTAVQDLKTYERFARAHEEGLQKLTAAFSRLYEAMPAAQKKTADDVFNSWQQRHEMHQTGERQAPTTTGQPG